MADRGNEHVNYLYRPLDPAILRLMRGVVDAAHRAGLTVGICGETAGDPLLTQVLLGLDIDEISMNPVAIPGVKSVLRGSSAADARQRSARRTPSFDSGVSAPTKMKPVIAIAATAAAAKFPATPRACSCRTPMAHG